jgi:molybdate transport system ATP-binding protein
VRLEIEVEKRVGGFLLDAQISTDGGIVALFGPSGSGKSLTLQCVAGTIEPDRGRIAADGHVLFDSGRRISLPPQERRVGYVPQSYALFPHLTVAQNIGFGLRRRPDAEVRVEVTRLALLLHLHGLEGRYPRQLSGGQQQRVALARALAVQPRLLLLDEPFSAIDALVREVLREDLATIHRELGVGVVLVTHDLADVHALADIVAVYDRGRVLQIGDREEVFRRPATADVARFTGARNLLPGTLVSSSGGQASVDVGGGVTFTVAGPSLGAGERVVVLVQAEGVRLLADQDANAPGEHIVPGVLTRGSLQGRAYTAHVTLGSDQGPEIEVVVPVWWWDRELPSPGQRLLVAVPQAAVHIMPPAVGSIADSSLIKGTRSEPG